MKKNITIALSLVLLVISLISCTKDKKTEENKTITSEPICVNHIDSNNDLFCDECGAELSSPEETIPVSIVTITTNEDSITIKDTQVLKYDYKTLFTITKDGVEIPVVDSYLDLTRVSDTPGVYEVICNFEGKSASVKVEVIETVYELSLSVEEITINKFLVSEYDYLSLFTAKVDGSLIEITEDMVSNNVVADVGTYEFTVTNKRVSKTLIVNVTNDHKIEIIKNYQDIKIHYNELEDYDFVKLFSLYVDGKAIQVTSDLLDITAVANASVGEEYPISMTYHTEENSLTETMMIKVIESKELAITAKNLVIYPNAEYIELTSLFEIKYGDEIIPVTHDMVSGSINYSTVGINEITLTYEDETAIATVEVKKGVVINHRYSDTITIMKGTNLETYSFANDFIVVVNGVEMDAISNAYFDLADLDFNTAGTYEVKISIPYNENRVGLSGVKFTYYEETINYVVVENDYEIDILNYLVELAIGTTEYNVYKNIKVRINNRNQTLTEVADYASVIACYVQTISEPIDFNQPGMQEVIIAVYVNGPAFNPVYVAYNVIIATDLSVEAMDKVVYTEETLYTTELFKITNRAEEIPVDNTMLTGHVDTFTPGVYYVDINYQGIKKTAKVVVLDRYIIGTYKTLQTSIPTVTTDASDEEVIIPGKLLGNLVINEDGTINLGSKKAQIINALDEKTFLIKFGGYEYTLYYDDGIVVLEPDNQIKLEYNNDKRPFIYFNIDVWQVQEKLTINSHDNHVLMASYPSYTIENFKIQRNSNYEQKWYGLKVAMVSKMNADTIYDVSWGDVEFADGFINDINQKSTLTLNGISYKFKVGANKTAKIYDDTNTKKFANTTFTGTYNSLDATLHVDQHSAYTFLVGTEKVFYVSNYDITQMKNGGPDFEEDSVLLYEFEDDIFAYKFNLDLENKTFEFIERKLLFGKYQFGEYMFFFDGYGTGIFKDNLKSYYEYPFNYSIKDKELQINFIKSDDKFIYGQTINLYLDDFGNILTIGSCAKEDLIGVKLENQRIMDGAIIRVNTTKIGKNTDTVAKQELYNSIEIITKDGIVSGNDIKNYVNTSAIRFNTPGFYQFTITVSVDGQTITSYYGLQILDIAYEDNELLGEYSGILDNKTKITIDKYGLSKVIFAGTLYEGLVNIKEDNSFSIIAYSSTRAALTITGNLVETGIINVRAVGAATFNEYLTIGNSDVIGYEGFILRVIQIGSNLTFALSNNKNSFGSLINVELLNGNSVFTKDSIIKIYDDNQEFVVKISTWGNTYSGLISGDNYRGNYTLTEHEDIFVDGFGSIKIADRSGTYDINNNVITVMIEDDVFVYTLNPISYTYEIVDIELNNSLVEGKSFKGSYTYYCSNYPYIAETSFTFSGNVVVIKSTSTNHNSGDEMCTDDYYSPPFASEDGVRGTYLVNGNKIVIEVNEITFIFKINNVLDATEIICLSTTLDSSVHGHFDVNTSFIALL